MFRSSTSSSERDSPWRFLARALVCGAPFLLLAGFTELVLWRSGESWPVRRVASVQSQLSDALYGRSELSQQIDLYKRACLELRSPDVVALGSSRVMQLTSECFTDSGLSFFNAGGMAQGLRDVRRYADDVRAGNVGRPRVAIIGIDPWWLLGSNAARTPGLLPDDIATRGAAHVNALRRWLRGRPIPWRAVTIGTLGPDPLGRPNAIGAGALQHASGFRIDGSRQYPPAYYDELRETGQYRDRESPPIIERIREFTHPFRRDVPFGHHHVEYLIEALRSLREDGVEVIVMLPPFADECRDELDSAEGHRGWWTAYREHVPHRLGAAGFPCSAPVSPRDMGVDDTWMFDGFHPGEPLIALVLADAIDLSGGLLAETVDTDALRRRAHAAELPVAFSPPPPRSD